MNKQSELQKNIYKTVVKTKSGELTLPGEFVTDKPT